jgi:hypothetical protein
MTETLAKPAKTASGGDAGAETSGLNERLESLKAQVDTLKVRVDEAKTWAQKRANVAGAWAANRREKVKDLAAEEPMMVVTVSAGVALLVGLGVGLLLAHVFDEQR